LRQKTRLTVAAKLHRIAHRRRISIEASEPMKVIVADKISDRGIQLLKDQPGWQIVLTNKDTLLAELPTADALIVRSATKVTADLLDKAPHLRAVGRAGVGVDNIDLEAATKRGVLVMSTPGGSSVSVAEHTFALLLALVRQLPKFDASMREGRWEKSSSAAEVRGKTLGLIGLGRIGSEVALRAEAFDMRVLAFDPFISEAAARELSVDLVSLEQLLAESDFISLHTAVVPQTQNMINAQSIAKMKKGVRIINAARGELINEADLAAAIREGHVAGAALDVFAEEPPKNCPLIGLPNVITTPHVAGSTAEAQEELGTQVAAQIKDYLVEGIIRNAVNLPALSADQYRRVRPYLALAERLGSLVSQAAAFRPARIRIRYAGEVAEVGTHLLRSAVLAGVLNAVLDEKVNVVNAPAVAAARGLRVEEETRKREHGFPNTLEVSALPSMDPHQAAAESRQGAAAPLVATPFKSSSGSESAVASPQEGFTAEGTVLHDGSPRVLNIQGIPLEAQLEGTILYLRNEDKPGVIGQVGSTLGQLGVNIATFTLGRSAAHQGAHAVSLVRVDGQVSPAILDPIRAIPAIT
jgi:D-3-phosphoglycerate dehydrogenase / 2-oxoglutarate reductase